ncbi:hypothetical protein F0562_034229 [Nyssa sinensis]|uniref:Uncharacterized protein n=1 Tax=Nyssa sinensis TaxID=561372 RepID=A0A5J5AKL0_9ASTE|nr:hypothetical protein F0562_034229 [Nyssa sinensis]
MNKGLETLKEHFKNSKFPCEVEEYMPVVFSPPRDGRRLTEPITIVGRANPHLLPLMDGENRPEQGENGDINYVSRNADEDDEVVGGGRSDSPPERRRRHHCHSLYNITAKNGYDFPNGCLLSSEPYPHSTSAGLCVLHSQVS